MDAEQKKLLRKRIEAHIISKDDCWITDYFISPASGKKSGKQQNIAVNGKPIALRRIAYEVYTGKSPGNLWVYHKCDNSLCINPEHLFLKRKGAGACKLTENQVREIKKLLFEQQFTIQKIATLFGVSSGAIANISRNQTWTHIPYKGE